jgi:hypothetical protein
VVVGAFAGFSSGFLGIGGGLAMTVGLTAWLKVPQRQAQMVGLALLAAPVKLPAAWVYWREGLLAPRPVLPGVNLGLVAGTDVGARLATGSATRRCAASCSHSSPPWRSPWRMRRSSNPRRLHTPALTEFGRLRIEAGRVCLCLPETLLAIRMTAEDSVGRRRLNDQQPRRGRSIFVRHAVQRSGLLVAILIAGFGLGIAYRFFFDEADQATLANFARSGFHGAGIGLTVWLVQIGCVSNARSRSGAALRRLPLTTEVLLKSLVMTAALLVVGLALQALLLPSPIGSTG